MEIKLSVLMVLVLMRIEKLMEILSPGRTAAFCLVPWKEYNGHTPSQVPKLISYLDRQSPIPPLKGGYSGKITFPP